MNLSPAAFKLTKFKIRKIKHTQDFLKTKKYRKRKQNLLPIGYIKVFQGKDNV